ncbi:hypothetical protein TRVA0_029S00518 [Trichomonascus vanleenenianus]|uniref:triose-phosphate isomerase n=1 Tax=Trichomonascus vanleenenianus TaxID=2268995 RepID=UPI003ECA252D
MLLVGVSLKTYMSIAKTKEYVSALSSVFSTASESKIQFFLIPDVVSLSVVKAPLPNNAWLGAQDTHYEDSGPYTGCISPKNLAEIGVDLVEIGHAERRAPPFNETDEVVAKKTAAALRNGMMPLICIGERERPAETKEAIEACVNQVKASFELCELPPSQSVIFAYEPVWAIGQSQPADPAYVVQVVQGIKDYLSTKLDSTQFSVIYGGSAGPGLLSKLRPTLDGIFLGRFGHDPAKVLEVIQEAAITLN